MLIPFESLPDHSRLWIYQSSRKFNFDEIAIISESLRSFTTRWAAHGTPLRASFDIRFNQYIILAADEQHHGASGCSIDDSARTIKELSQTLGIDLFDRSNIGFYVRGEVQTIPLNELKKKYEAGQWNHESTFINYLAKTKGDLATEFLIPAASTWLKRYLPHEKVAD